MARWAEAVLGQVGCGLAGLVTLGKAGLGKAGAARLRTAGPGRRALRRCGLGRIAASSAACRAERACAGLVKA